jgi:hypothetical protein
VSDIDTEAMDSLKALDPNRPIREADMTFSRACPLVTQSGHQTSLNGPHLNGYDTLGRRLGGGNETAPVHHASW